MALFEINPGGTTQPVRTLESVALTNLVPGTALTVSKAIAVPDWAECAQFVLCTTTFSGTTPLLDFILQGTYDLDTTHFWNLGDWDGITQLTAHTPPVVVAIDVGPYFTADDTGSATASCRYGVQTVLPPWIVYKYTLDATTNDEDYSFTLKVKFAGKRG